MPNPAMPDAWLLSCPRRPWLRWHDQPGVGTDADPALASTFATAVEPARPSTGLTSAQAKPQGFAWGIDHERFIARLRR